jgi:hypothetical protein
MRRQHEVIPDGIHLPFIGARQSDPNPDIFLWQFADCAARLTKLGIVRALRELRHMAEPTLSMHMDDDLPRTIRRERDAKEAREREARERERSERVFMDPPPVHAFERQPAYTFASPAGASATFDVPFSKLAGFFVKAVFAAIPALLIFAGLLWLVGQGLQAFFPDLVKLKILIYVPK